MNEIEEIKQRYLLKHDTLTSDYYEKGLLSKEEFDQDHGKLWNDYWQELLDKGLIVESEPPRLLGAEIDALELRIKALER